MIIIIIYFKHLEVKFLSFECVYVSMAIVMFDVPLPLPSPPFPSPPLSPPPPLSSPPLPSSPLPSPPLYVG